MATNFYDHAPYFNSKWHCWIVVHVALRDESSSVRCTLMHGWYCFMLLRQIMNFSDILRLCLGVWRGGEGITLGFENIRENREIFYIF